jgi:hypothetical protein
MARQVAWKARTAIIPATAAPPPVAAIPVLQIQAPHESHRVFFYFFWGGEGGFRGFAIISTT